MDYGISLGDYDMTTPLYENHRHLGGSIRAETVCELLYNSKYADHIQEVRSSMRFNGGDYGFLKFLRKFDILNRVQWDEKSICKTIYQIVDDVKDEGIEHAEIHFSVNKYLNHLRWTPPEAVKFLYDIFSQYSKQKGVDICLILCLQYEVGSDKQIEIASSVLNKAGDCVAGIDLVGDESFFNVDFYRPILKEWKYAGKGIIVHAGESQSAENVRLSIEELGADRIAHGIKVPLESPDILKLARDSGVCFDIALTSNVCTGVVSEDLSRHPALEMLKSGCDITIGTDDPVICNTTLDKEYKLLKDNFHISDDEIRRIKENSIKHALK